VSAAQADVVISVGGAVVENRAPPAPSLPQCLARRDRRNGDQPGRKGTSRFLYTHGFEPHLSVWQPWLEPQRGAAWAGSAYRPRDWGRELVWYLARQRTGMTLQTLGAAPGIGAQQTVGKAAQRFTSALSLPWPRIKLPLLKTVVVLVLFTVGMRMAMSAEVVVPCAKIRNHADPKAAGSLAWHLARRCAGDKVLLADSTPYWLQSTLNIPAGVSLLAKESRLASYLAQRGG